MRSDEEAPEYGDGRAAVAAVVSVGGRALLWLALGAVVPRGELLGQFRAPPHVDKYTPDGRIPSAAELA